MLDEDRTPAPSVLEALPIFPLPNALLLPGMVLPLNVFEPRYLALVDHALAGGRHIGVPLLRPGQDGADRPEIEPIFGVGKLLSHQRLPDGRRFIRLEGLGRVRMLAEHDTDQPFRTLEVEALPEDPVANPALTAVLRAQIERIVCTLDDADAEMVRCVLRVPDDRVFCYAVTAIIPTLGLVLPDADALPGGRCPHLHLQQQCLDAEDTDARASLLIERTANICDCLGESGRFPRVLLN